MLDDPVLQACRHFTDEMRKDQLCFFMHDKVEFAKKEEREAYLNVVHTPMDLTTVKTNLDSGKYPNYLLWAEDMNLIFENCIKFNGALSLYGGIAQYCKNKLNHFMKTVQYANPRNAEHALIEACKNIEQLLKEAPMSIGNYQMNTTLSSLEPFSAQRIEKLMENINKLAKNPDNLPGINAIVQDSGEIPKIENGIIDLAFLSRTSLVELEQYCKMKGM